MPTPPPRKRFQIHLSTAIVMMFVAGALIWANLKVRTPFDSSLIEDLKGLVSLDEPLEMFANPAKSPNKVILWDKGYGWPKVAYYLPTDQFFRWSLEPSKPKEYQVSYPTAGIDAATALLILFLAWFLCEYLIRRRAAQKKS